MGIERTLYDRTAAADTPARIRRPPDRDCSAEIEVGTLARRRPDRLR